MMPPVHASNNSFILSISARFLVLAVILAVLGLAVPAAKPNARPSIPPQLKALALPPGRADAATDGVPKPFVFRSLRLSSQSRTVVLFSGEGDVEEIPAGQKLSMSFDATGSFDAVGALLTSWGTEDSVATLSLRNAAGREIGEATSALRRDRDWVALSVPTQPAGRYALEIAKQGIGRLGWVGKSIKARDQRQIKTSASAIGFRPGEFPQYANSSFSIPAGFHAEALYFLGGLSSYDHGMSWWDDYEVRGDFGDRQFVGDLAGRVEIVYDDGTADSIPLIFGWNMWWYNHFDGPEAGGPFLEPFLSDAEARAVLLASLKLENFSADPAARYYWTYLPRPKKIAEIRLVDNPEKQGFPLIRAITVVTSDGASNLTSFEADDGTDASKLGNALAISPFDLATSSFRQPIERLKRVLYTFRDGLPSSVPRQTSDLAPKIEFSGPVEAEILSNVFAANLPDLLAKQDDDGKFHASSKDSINWGSYQGIGTWRPGAAPFYNQSWARDMGRALLEFVRLGFLAKAEAGVKFADSRLNDLPNGYPGINREGKKVPPHWTTVLGEPLYGDRDGKGDGDQANDGHGLLLLAHYRVWQQKGRDPAWLQDRWPFIRDAAEWYAFQLDNPAFSRATEVLYSESEASHDGGYDVYSNFIALKGLDKSSEMATALGQTALAARWTQYAARLKRGMLDQLTGEDPQFGKVWKPVAWSWGYANESLGPLILAADVDGYDQESADPALLPVSLNTYARQKSYPSGLAAPQTLGYGQSFLTQAALLADDVEAYSKALGNLARFIFYPRHLPYLVPEGVTLHPSGEYWYRNGDLGNAVHQAEVLKTLSIVAGVDNLRSGEVKLIPRLPDGWTGMKVVDFPVSDGRAKLSYALTRYSASYQLRLKLSDKQDDVRVRLGPVPESARDIRATVDGKTIAFTVTRAGSRLWVWISKLDGEPGKETEIRLDWTGG